MRVAIGMELGRATQDDGPPWPLAKWVPTPAFDGDPDPDGWWLVDLIGGLPELVELAEHYGSVIVLAADWDRDLPPGVQTLLLVSGQWTNWNDR